MGSCGPVYVHQEGLGKHRELDSTNRRKSALTLALDRSETVSIRYKVRTRVGRIWHLDWRIWYAVWIRIRRINPRIYVFIRIRHIRRNTAYYGVIRRKPPYMTYFCRPYFSPQTTKRANIYLKPCKIRPNTSKYGWKKRQKYVCTYYAVSVRDVYIVIRRIRQYLP